MDSLTARYGQTVVSIGPWAPPAGGNVGSKISYTLHPRSGGQLVSWLDTIQLRDLDTQARIELTCRRCGKVRFVTPQDILSLGDYGHLWLSEVCSLRSAVNSAVARAQCGSHCPTQATHAALSGDQRSDQKRPVYVVPIKSWERRSC
jgi:hypothetical protein